jgi:hypothetical protein
MHCTNLANRTGHRLRIVPRPEATAFLLQSALRSFLSWQSLERHERARPSLEIRVNEWLRSAFFSASYGLRTYNVAIPKLPGGIIDLLFALIRSTSFRDGPLGQQWMT